MNTVAPCDKSTGTGKVTEEITASKMSAGILAASSPVVNAPMTSPRRRRAANDGRNRRTRRINVELRMSLAASLPPYTGSFWSISIERVERVYDFIASSISDLTRQQSFRGSNVINNDIISSIQVKRECEQVYRELVLMQVYD